MSDLRTARTAQIDEIVKATSLGTLTLASWALNWHHTNGLTFVWQLIAGTQDQARAFYAEIKDELIDDGVNYLRWCAAEALVDGGWTLAAINRRKS